MRVVTKESPNQSARVHGDKAVRLIVCHTPEGSYRAMVDYICRSSARVSYHLLLNEDGTEATQFVPWNRKAWHAGPVNSLSDGVSAAGYAHNFKARSPQGRAFARVVAERLVARNLPCRWSRYRGFCRHADLQDDRSDPMNLHEWTVFCALVRKEYRRLKGNPKRLKAIRKWIRKRRRAGWSWARLKKTANWREFRRLGGR